MKAYDVRLRKKVEMKVDSVIKYKTSRGDRYRLAGRSANGNKLSRFVTKGVAEREAKALGKKMSIRKSRKA